MHATVGLILPSVLFYRRSYLVSVSEDSCSLILPCHHNRLPFQFARRTEVNQVANLLLTNAQGVGPLGIVLGCEGFDGLKFDNNFAEHSQVWLVLRDQLVAVVSDIDDRPADVGNVSQGELDLRALLFNFFCHAEVEQVVDLEGRTHQVRSVPFQHRLLHGKKSNTNLH